MKLVRFGAVDAEKPGLIDENGTLRDLSAHISDITPDHLSPDSLRRLSDIDPEKLRLVTGRPRLGVPLKGVRKFVAIGLNYDDHAREAGLEPPSEPIFFYKAISCLSGPYDPIMLPRGSTKTDWEVELGVVIGSRARYVEEGAALSHVAGYLVVNDVSERHFQKELGSQWDKGKGCDTFGPVGPWLVTADEVSYPQNLTLWLDVNGQQMQRGSTQNMIFGVARLISYVSRFITLDPGDIITTGTPPGVGEAQKPEPIFLKPGDVMRLGIHGLGVQQQTVIDWRP